VVTDTEVMDCVDRVLDCVTALEPMAEILVESGVTIPLNLSGAALLFMAVTGEMLRTRALYAYQKLGALDGASDAGGLGPDAAVLEAARAMLRDALDLGVIGPVEVVGGDGS
jgi:hypothetical protein